MEYIIMFLSHIYKTAEYFAIAGFPEITLDTLLPTIQAVIFDLAKLASIYSAVIFN